MPDSSDRLPASPCRRSPRSLRSAAVAVVLTGALIVVIPLGLLLGQDGLVPVSLHRDTPVPAPHLLACDSGKVVASHDVAPGQCVDIVGAGFRASELIQVSDSRHPSRSAFVRADDAGRYRLRRVTSAAAAAGPEVLTFVGLARADSDATPRLTFCRFTVITAQPAN